MVVVDPQRCSYCGGCVAVCPVGALCLSETRLLVDETCTECGLCMVGCPSGALSSATRAHGRSALPLSSHYDVIVVGAGPAGSVAARTCTRRGLSVLLVEKRQEIGSPVRCAEGVGHAALLPFIEPSPLDSCHGLRSGDHHH